MPERPPNPKNERREIEAEASRRADEAAASKAYARRIVALFNARAARGRRPAFFPTIRCALVAEMPIVHTVCPACRTITETDLRTIDHHPLATIASIIPKASCRQCRPNAPFARIIEIKASAGAGDVRSPFATWGMMPPRGKG
jgi:hypothetical protein